MMSPQNYAQFLKGFRITGCSIRSKDIFYFTVIEDTPDRYVFFEENLKTRLVIYFGDRKGTEKEWGQANYEGFGPILAAATKTPREQFIGVDSNGQVISIGSGQNAIETSIPSTKQGPIRGGVRKAKTIAGKAYVCSGYRGLARRDDENLWTTLCDGLVFQPRKDESSLEYGFDDFDSYDGQNFYCIGGKNDCWRRLSDGSWHALSYPGRGQVQSIVCIAPEIAYVSDDARSIWRIEGDDWHLHVRHPAVPAFQSMVRFKDRVYATTGSELWQIDKEGIVDFCDVPDGINGCVEFLDAQDGILLTAGYVGAACWDGDTWTWLFKRPQT